MQTFQFQVSLMRFFWRIEAAFANAFTIHHNLHQPFTLMRANAQKTRFIGSSCFTHILQIAESGHFSQICKRVVQLVSVDVINVNFRHLSRYVKPSQSVRQSFDVVNGNGKVSGAVDRARSSSDKIGAAMVFTPSKNAGLCIVIQRFAQMFNGNVKFGSHDIQFTIRAA